MLCTCQSVCIVVINTLEIITLFSVKDNMHLLNHRQEHYRLIIPVCYVLPDIFFTLVFESADSSMASTLWLYCTAKMMNYTFIGARYNKEGMFSVRSSLKKHRKLMLFIHLLLSVDTWFFLPFCCNWMAGSVDVLHKWRRNSNILLYIYAIKFIV